MKISTAVCFLPFLEFQDPTSGYQDEPAQTIDWKSQPEAVRRLFSDLSSSSWNDCLPFMLIDLFAVLSTQVLGSLKKKPQRRLGRLPDCGDRGRDSSGSLGWVGWQGGLGAD